MNSKNAFKRRSLNTSLYVEVYTEAKIDGVWTNIDFWTRYPPGRPNVGDNRGEHIVPSLNGGSRLYSVLRDLDICYPLKHEELSSTLQQHIHKIDESEAWTLKAFPAAWLYAKNLDLPEYGGYLTRQSILNYESGLSHGELSDYDMLTPEEYRNLSPDEQSAYQYYEWTEKWGERDILKRIKENVQERMLAYDDYGRAWDSTQKKFLPEQIDWPDVRVVVYIC